MRNVSQIYSSASTIIDPRYAPTNFRRQTVILRQLMDDQTEYVARDRHLRLGRHWAIRFTPPADSVRSCSTRVR